MTAARIFPRPGPQRRQICHPTLTNGTSACTTRAEGLFAAFDFDHDGNISRAELIGAITAANEELHKKPVRPTKGLELHTQRHNSLAGRWAHKAHAYAREETARESNRDKEAQDSPKKPPQMGRKLTRAISTAVPSMIRAMTRSYKSKKKKKGKKKKGGD